jgi:hypothetical protein
LDAGGEGLVGSGWIAGCGEREGRGGIEARPSSAFVPMTCGPNVVQD